VGAVSYERGTPVTHVVLMQANGKKEAVPDPMPERELFIDNLLVRIHFGIVMIRWTGLAPREFEFPFPGSLTSTSLQANGKKEAVPDPMPAKKPPPIPVPSNLKAPPSK